MPVKEGFSMTPVGSYLFKANNRNPRARCEICSKLTKNTPEQRHCFSVFTVDFEQVSAN